jgi:signal transduction histidine kinase
VRVRDSAGSVANVEALQRDEADVGLSYADVAYIAFVGRLEGRPQAFDELRGIAVLDLTPFHLVVGANSGIRDAAGRLRFSVFEVLLGRTRYQVVARLLYRDALREQLEGVFGFTVNLDWARRSCFPDVTRQVSRIGEAGSGLALAVLDERGERVAGTSAEALPEPTTRRAFPLSFFDPGLVALESSADLGRTQWIAMAAAGADPTLAEAPVGSNQTLAIAAAILAIGLVLTAQATRAHARLTELRSEFVQTVTHELKTPIASIRAAGDTMARGRVSGPQALKEYAQLVVQESKRLTRLVDNLLAYARITDVTEAYTFEPIDLRALVDEVLEGFKTTLTAGDFAVKVDVDANLPLVRADRTACTLLLDNLVDNAVRYSKQEKCLAIRSKAVGGYTLTPEG